MFFIILINFIFWHRSNSKIHCHRFKISARNSFFESFDKILVDAPCSGIGLLRRKPEIRYTKTLNDSKQLHEIQLAILNAVAAKVKKGGIITYSTCTILQQENDDTVQAFLAEHPEFELVKTTTARKVKDNRHSPTLTILPSDFDSDGFFISSL